MTALSNPRHEVFAQELARGKTGNEAYVTAGFKSNRANAGKLRRKHHIETRVAEIVEDAARRAEKATERAVERAALSREVVIQMMLDDRELARANDQAAAAIRATELIGKECFRMFIDRREQGKPGDFSHLSDAEIEEKLMGELLARGMTEPQARAFLDADEQPRGYD